MSDELKKMLIAQAIKNGAVENHDNSKNLLLRAEINMHDDGVSVQVMVDPAADFVFGSDFWQKQSDLLAPVLMQIADNLNNVVETAAKNWKEF